MNYKESRDILLQAKELSYQQAEEILRLWISSPKAYHDFLRLKNKSMTVSQYAGIAENEVHTFIPTEAKVPSTDIAEKFFALEDVEIIANYMEVISHYLPEGIYAFPYLTKKCIEYMDREILGVLFLNMQFIFDFKEDENGYLFDMMYTKLGDRADKELLAVNSFNIFGWLQTKRPQTEKAKIFLMSQHAWNTGFVEEASFRKLFIQYVYDIESKMLEFEEELNPQAKMRN